MRIQQKPYLFPDMLSAASALHELVAEWSGYQQYEILVVHEGGERAFAGFHVRAKCFDGFTIGHVAPGRFGEEEA